MGWRDYVSFEPSKKVVDSIVQEGRDPSVALLPPYDQRQFERALDELWQTPEGREKIIGAANSFPDKVIHISNNGPNGDSLALGDGTIAVGGRDAGFMYKNIHGDYKQVSIQHFLYHELVHLQPNQAGARGDEVDGGQVSISKEKEAIAATNIFMKKYYNEIPRVVDPHAGRYEYANLRRFDTGFKAEGYGRGKDVRYEYSMNGQDITRQTTIAPPTPSTTPVWDASLGNG